MKLLIVLLLLIAVEIQVSEGTTEEDIDIRSGDQVLEKINSDTKTIIERDGRTETSEISSVKERTAEDESDLSRNSSPSKENNERSADLSEKSGNSDNTDITRTATEVINADVNQSSSEDRSASSAENHDNREARKVTIPTSDAIKQKDTIDRSSDEEKFEVRAGNDYHSSITKEVSNISRSSESGSYESDSGEGTGKKGSGVLRSFVPGRKALRGNQRDVIQELLKSRSARPWKEESVETGPKTNHGGEVRNLYQGQRPYSDPYGYNLMNYPQNSYNRFANDPYRMQRNNQAPQDNRKLSNEDYSNLYENAYPYRGSSVERKHEIRPTEIRNQQPGTYNQNLNSFFQLYGHRY